MLCFIRELLMNVVKEGVLMVGYASDHDNKLRHEGKVVEC